MNVTETSKQTNTLGFFNGNRWPIHLFISELNTTLALQPGEFILDRAGRKINDPFFERYTKSYRLSKEVSEKAVPLIVIPVVSPAVPATGESSVREVTKFTSNPQGVKMPVLPMPAALSQPLVQPNHPSIKTMSVEEARRKGLIKRTRDVPEDFGVTDTEGLPPSGIPAIKYATDTSRTPVLPLPKELTEQTATEKMPESTVETRTPESPFGNSTVVEVAPPLPPPTRTAAPRPAPVRTPAIRHAPVRPENESSTPRRTVAMPAVEETSPAQEAPLPEPEIDENEDEFDSEVPKPPATFVCQADGQPFESRAALEAHVRKYHPSIVKELMSPYQKS